MDLSWLRDATRCRECGALLSPAAGEYGFCPPHHPGAVRLDWEDDTATAIAPDGWVLLVNGEEMGQRAEVKDGDELAMRRVSTGQVNPSVEAE